MMMTPALLMVRFGWRRLVMSLRRHHRILFGQDIGNLSSLLLFAGTQLEVLSLVLVALDKGNATDQSSGDLQ
jgi:hypothetical protein